MINDCGVHNIQDSSGRLFLGLLTEREREGEQKHQDRLGFSGPSLYIYLYGPLQQKKAHLFLYCTDPSL